MAKRKNPSKWLREMNGRLSLSLSLRWRREWRSIIRMNGQRANTYKTPKAGKEWLWSNVTFFPRNYSWKAGSVVERWERRVTGDIGEREAGERKFPIPFVDWTTGGDFEGKKKSDRCSRSCVGSIRAPRPTHTDVAFFGQRNESPRFPSLSLPFPRDKPDCRYHCLTPGGNLDSMNSKLGLSHLWPPPFDRNLWKERKIADRSNSPISQVCHDRTSLSNLSRKRNSRKGLNKVKRVERVMAANNGRCTDFFTIFLYSLAVDD